MNEEELHQQLHIAIAQLEGWSVEQEAPSTFSLKRHGRFIMDCDSEWAAWFRTPRYLGERDEMVDVIIKHCSDQAVRVRFLNALRASLKQPASDFDMMVASCEKMAEALLKALNIPPH